MSRSVPRRDRRPWLPFTADLSAQDWLVLAALLLLGLALRLVALRAPPLPVDLNNWTAWTLRLRSLGPGRFYDGNSLADFGPAYALVLGGIGFVAKPGSATASAVYRLPAVLADLAIGAVVFVAVLRLGRQRAAPARRPVAASIAAALWLLNPAAILLAAAWGQIESVYALFLLLSVLLLDASPLASLACFVLALLIEPRSLELAPLVAIALVARHGWRAMIGPALAALALWCVVCIPFFGVNVIGGPLGTLNASGNTYSETALNALNLWAIGRAFQPDVMPIVAGLTPLTVGLLLYGFGLWYGVVVLLDQLRRRTDLLLIGAFGGAYLLLLPYMVLTRQHERWLLPALPLLLVFAFACLRRPAAGSRFRVVPALLYGALSACLFLDLYRVYEQGLYGRAPVPASMGFYTVIAASALVWAALAVWAFWTLAVLAPWWLPAGAFRQAAAPPEADDARAAPAVAYDRRVG